MPCLPLHVHANRVAHHVAARELVPRVQKDIFHAIKAIVATQRDYGRRDDRKQARLKYLVSEWGINKFRGVVEQYFGKKFEPFKPLPAWEFKDYLGWGKQGDGSLFYGCWIQNGRLKGDMKATLRRVIEEYNLSVRLTPNQNLILCGVQPAWKEAVENALRGVGIVPPAELDTLDPLRDGLPRAGRSAASRLGRRSEGCRMSASAMRVLLDRMGLPDETIVMRMTGCPNGCASCVAAHPPVYSSVRFCSLLRQFACQVWHTACWRCIT